MQGSEVTSRAKEIRGKMPLTEDDASRLDLRRVYSRHFPCLLQLLWIPAGSIAVVKDPPPT